MTDRFVSTKELDEARRRRQEEWEKVRKPDDPAGTVLFLLFISSAN